MTNLNYKWLSYRRKMLDVLQEKYNYLYEGIVLDIGGRDLGEYKKPKDKVKKWIFADINKDNNPDIVLDVANMEKIESNSIDVVNAIELFEHVQDIEKGIKECYRVLKENGLLLLSSPFLFHVHADPYDFQRWTSIKWRSELLKNGFKIEKLIVMGKFFSFFAQMIKTMLRSIAAYLYKGRLILSTILPFLNLMTRLDNRSFVKNHPVLDNYHYGYFIIARK